MKSSSVHRLAQNKFWRAFLLWSLLMLAGFGVWRWVCRADEIGSVPWPLRKVFAFNQKVSEIFYQPQRKAPEFPRNQAGMPRENGDIGMDDDDELQNWKLTVDFPNKKFFVTMEQIKKLPHVDMVTELKCVEGWSKVVRWGGS